MISLVFITLIIGGIIIFRIDSCDDNIFIARCGIVITLVVVIVIILGLTHSVVSSQVLDQKIQLYEEENAKIEQDIKIAVESYMKYESDTITNILSDVESDSYINILTAFPELKTDELIKQQIEIYSNNNNEIKLLKQEKIDVQTYKWLLYFGH